MNRPEGYKKWEGAAEPIEKDFVQYWKVLVKAGKGIAVEMDLEGHYSHIQVV